MKKRMLQQIHNPSIRYIAAHVGMKSWRNLLCCLLCLSTITFSSVTRAGFEDGVDAFLRGNYKRAYAEWLPLARGGDANAARNLARLYLEGLGTPQNHEQARFWYEISAKKCDATAQNNLAIMILNGQGGTKDPVRAFRLFEKAANQGIHADSDAMGNIAGMYLAGSGRQVNVIEAYKWYVLYAEYTTDESNRRKLQAFLPQLENAMTASQKTEGRKRATTFRPTRCILKNSKN